MFDHSPLSLNHFKELKKLQQKKYRQEKGLCLVEGSKTIKQISDNGIKLEELIINNIDIDLLAKLQYRYLWETDKSRLDRLAVTKSPQDLIAVVKTEFKAFSSDDFIIYLDRISDPGNLGAIYRTACAAEISGIALTSDSCDPFNSKVIRASLGTVFSVPTKIVKQQWLLNHKNKIIAAVQDKGKNIFTAQVPNKNIILVIGSEAHGINTEILNHADEKVNIPISDKIESLNAAVAAGVMIYQLKYIKK